MSRALWLEVSPALRAARVTWNDSSVCLYFYYDGEISEEDNESAECVATEFISSHPDYRLEVEILRWDYPQAIPQQEGETVYYRREPNHKDPCTIKKKEYVLSRQAQNTIDRVGAILSMSRALWGEVSPPLRAARIKWNDKEVHLFFYYDGEISEEDRESAECVATEVISDFPEYQLEGDILRLDYPHRIPNEGELVYRRREITPDQGKWPETQ